MDMYKGWDWVVRSYIRGRLMLETVHKGTFSRDMEIEAALSCRRQVKVYEVMGSEAWPWRHFEGEM